MLFVLSSCAIGKSFFQQPDYFPKPAYDLKKNKPSAAIIELGRVLFYDPHLSQNNTISCVSCHSPYNAFSHTDHALSHGINDLIGTRNAPALQNLAWQPYFMWDGAIPILERQPLAPITHPKEMGSSLKELLPKLQQSVTYRKLFFNAYGDSIVQSDYVLRALAQFQLTLVSNNAKYDSVRRGESSFSEQQSRGYALFIKFCNSCHREPLFSNYEFANNGLPIDTNLNDLGRFSITRLPTDSFKFKIPSLRNLSYTFPYMHDGRFKNLNQVLKHYTKGVQAYSNVPNQLRSGLPLSNDDKVDLIAFLLTLNDKTFIFTPTNKLPKKYLNTILNQ